MICFYLSLTRRQLLNIITLWIHHVALGGYNGFANFSLTMGSLGSFASSSCSLARRSATPCLPPCIVCSPAPRHQSGIRALWTSARPAADVKRQMGACWTRLLWSQQTVQFTKNWFSGTVSVCLLATDSPCSAASYLSAGFKKPIRPIFHQSWTVYIMTCYDVFLRQYCLKMYNDIISSLPDEHHIAHCVKMTCFVVHSFPTSTLLFLS